MRQSARFPNAFRGQDAPGDDIQMALNLDPLTVRDALDFILLKAAAGMTARTQRIGKRSDVINE